MTDEAVRARLLNAGGELIAEGPCWVDEPASQATMEPDRTPGVLQKERGRLVLEFDAGPSYVVSDKPLIFRLRQYGSPGAYDRRKFYRLRLVGSLEGPASQGAQDADAVGAAGNGVPAPRSDGGPRFIEETLAAR